MFIFRHSVLLQTKKLFIEEFCLSFFEAALQIIQDFIRGVDDFVTGIFCFRYFLCGFYGHLIGVKLPEFIYDQRRKCFPEFFYW
jgi:hypothetical protein